MIKENFKIFDWEKNRRKFINKKLKFDFWRVNIFPQGIADLEFILSIKAPKPH